MQELERKIGYTFRDRSLLETALTHSSYANERGHGASECYERLEFLGDSILGYITAEFLYRHEPSIPEGRMTRLRAELVCETSLHQIAQRLDLGRFMLLGKGEERTGGRERPSILADMVESLIAAMYLDSGSLEQPRRFILEELLQQADLGEQHQSEDYKTMLQELVQRRPNQKIAYELVGETGPDHDKTFVAEVIIGDKAFEQGTGHTKKAAEQAAAYETLLKLKNK